MIEYKRRIESLTLDARLEMQMDACCPSCLPFKADRFTGLQPLPDFDEIA